jgi:hypothetical protein
MAACPLQSNTKSHRVTVIRADRDTTPASMPVLAEATRTYSNRFAAAPHPAPASVQRAGGTTRPAPAALGGDDSYPPATRDLPYYGLRAECWVEGVGADYESGGTTSTYRYVATDQVGSTGKLRRPPLPTPTAAGASETVTAFLTIARRRGAGWLAGSPLG